MYEEYNDSYRSFAQVYDAFMDNVPYAEWADYVQSLLNKMYGIYENQVLTDKDFRRCLQIINSSRQEDYRNLYKLLTPNQATLLVAIAKEHSVKAPTAGAFMQKYHLKAVGSVQRALQYLLENEYIYTAEQGYIIYDRFLAFWLRTI